MSAVRITISTRARAKSPSRCTRSTIANRRSKIENEIWARLDSNQGPRDYESPALPLSYRPVSDHALKHIRPLVTNPESFRGWSTDELQARVNLGDLEHNRRG